MVGDEVFDPGADGWLDEMTSVGRWYYVFELVLGLYSTMVVLLKWTVDFSARKMGMGVLRFLSHV